MANRQTRRFWQSKGNSSSAVPLPLSESRTLEQINKDYTEACAQLGQFHYQSEVLRARMQQLSSKIAKMSKEADELKAKEQSKLEEIPDDKKEESGTN